MLGVGNRDGTLNEMETYSLLQSIVTACLHRVIHLIARPIFTWKTSCREEWHRPPLRCSVAFCVHGRPLKTQFFRGKSALRSAQNIRFKPIRCAIEQLQPWCKCTFFRGGVRVRETVLVCTIWRNSVTSSLLWILTQGCPFH